MKEKVFYIVNLDKKRISVLSLFLVGLLFSFFFLGVSVGKGNAIVQNRYDAFPQENKKVIEKPENSESTEDQTVTFSNKAPEILDSNKVSNEESEVVDLQTPGENVKRQENLHQDKPAPNLQKKSPKKQITASSNTGSGSYTIQLAAFTSLSDAEFYIKRIIKDNPNLKSKPFSKKSGKFYLVRIGGSNDQDELKNLLKNLKIDEKIRNQALIVKNS
ncbi:MAG: SPOR domain-containing protein [Leptospira sp.]|nr:SPOR domain-containing protein [Leptospira sp.]